MTHSNKHPQATSPVGTSTASTKTKFFPKINRKILAFSLIPISLVTVFVLTYLATGNRSYDPSSRASTLSSQSTNPSYTELKIYPEADTKVYKSNPSSNYGTSNTLEVDGSPVKLSYLRFSLENPTLSGKTITSAKLRLRITNPSTGTQTIKAINNSWSESRLTYNSKPAFGSNTPLATITNAKAETWYEIDLTNYISSKIGQKISLAIDSSASDGVDFYSRESSSNKPHLLITHPSEQTTVSTPISSGLLSAFPGAEGFGAKSIGGRGGKIMYVTHTKDTTNINSPDYPGSFRAAINATGPRIVLFKVSGYITAVTDFRIKNPYITIAGQTAPGDGIVIRGAPLLVMTHDVVIRGMRIRPGDDPGGYPAGQRDGLTISSKFNDPNGPEVYNVIIDHSSISWGIDENMSTWTEKVRDVTIQWSINSEALHDSIHVDEGQPAGTYDDHSMGFLIGPGAQRISFHHNLIAHVMNRLPRVDKETSTEFINNVVYDWHSGIWPAVFVSDTNSAKPTYSNFINNYYIRGVETRSTPRVGVLLDSRLGSGSKIFVNGNLFLNQDGSLLGTDIIYGDSRYRSSSLISNSNLPAPAVSTQTPERAYEYILENVGAISPRDEVDKYVINTVKTRTGGVIDCIVSCNEPTTDRRNYHEGWPIYNSAQYPTDTDNDGIPDDWEKNHNLDPNNSSDGGAYLPDGYTRVEEYINSLIPTIPGVFTISSTSQM